MSRVGDAGQVRPVELDVVVVLPDLLDVHADSGNAHTLAARAGWEGVDVRVHLLDTPEGWPANVDVVLVGDGDSDEIAGTLERLVPFASVLRGAVDAGCPLLAVGLGMHLLAHSCTTDDGRRYDGVGVFDGTSGWVSPRISRELVVDEAGTILVGYENHALCYRRAASERPLGVVRAGTGADDGTEGVRKGAAIGTELHGPVLVNNPVLAIEILDAAMRRRHGVPFVPCSARAQRADAIVDRARRAIAARAGARVFAPAR